MGSEVVELKRVLTCVAVETSPYLQRMTLPIGSVRLTPRAFDEWFYDCLGKQAETPFLDHSPPVLIFITIVARSK